MTVEPAAEGRVRDEIALGTAQEHLRQQRETFDQRKRHDGRWFLLKLVMGWIAVALLPGIAVICGFVIFSPERYSTTTVAAATAALFVDTLGLVMSVWRLVLGKGPDPLQPVTDTPAQMEDQSPAPAENSAN
jgi:hypothetical protein